MRFYRKETEEKVFEYDNKCCFCCSTEGFMLQCDRLNCKNLCHPICLNEDRKESATKEDKSIISWQFIHTDAVSDNCKAIPDRQGLGIIGYEGCELIEEYRENEWKRGGYITIYCDIHRDLEEY